MTPRNTQAALHSAANRPRWQSGASAKAWPLPYLACSAHDARLLAAGLAGAGDAAVSGGGPPWQEGSHLSDYMNFTRLLLPADLVSAGDVAGDVASAGDVAGGGPLGPKQPRRLLCTASLQIT